MTELALALGLTGLVFSVAGFAYVAREVRRIEEGHTTKTYYRRVAVSTGTAANIGNYTITYQHPYHCPRCAQPLYFEADEDGSTSGWYYCLTNGCSGPKGYGGSK